MRCRSQPLNRIELLFLAGSLIGAALLFQPLLSHGRERADRAECRRNLEAIIKEAHHFGSKYGGVLPLAPPPHPPSYRSLQKLADQTPALRPEHFVCPGSGKLQAAATDPPRYVLQPENCSYAWLGEFPSDPLTAPWISDEAIASAREPQPGADNHLGGLNVGYGDRSVVWISTEDLPAGELLPSGLVNNLGERPQR